MKEYIPRLIKNINEIYFRKYQDTDFYMIKKDYTDHDLITLMNISEEFDDRDLRPLLKDLFTISFGNGNNTIGFSKLMYGILTDLRVLAFKFDHVNMPQDVINVLSHSKESYLVGGSVRDILLGKDPKDFDFVTDIDYDTMSELFINAGFTVKETGKQFLVMIVSKDGKDYEIANFRTDGNYSDGRRPDSVSIGDIYQDSARRDFCINSLYYSLSNKTLRDPTGIGIEDIKTKTLRFIGKAEDRIKNDYLRVFRFYRFLSNGFKPESKSLATVRRLFDEACKKTNPERIKNEIEKIIKL